MSGFLRILAAGLVLAAAAGLYGLKHRVEERRESVESLEQQILRDSEAIRVLKAERAYLTTPSSLESLAREYLTVRPVRAAQIAPSLAMLPFRGPGRPDSGPLASARHGESLQPRVKPTPPKIPALPAAVAAARENRDRTAPDAAEAHEDAFAERVRAVLNRLGEDG